MFGIAGHNTFPFFSNAQVGKCNSIKSWILNIDKYINIFFVSESIYHTLISLYVIV